MAGRRAAARSLAGAVGGAAGSASRKSSRHGPRRHGAAGRGRHRDRLAAGRHQGGRHDRRRRSGQYNRASSRVLHRQRRRARASTPTATAPTTSGRRASAANAGRGAGSKNLDLTLTWGIGVGERGQVQPPGRGGQGGNERMRFEIYIRATNVLNIVNPQSFNGVMTSPFFGMPTSASAAGRVVIGSRVRSEVRTASTAMRPPASDRCCRR